MYPNFFALLVSPPGVGKSQAIAQAEVMWRAANELKVAPSDMTKASLVDALADSRKIKVYHGTELLEMHPLLVAVDELGVLLPAHDLSFMSVANKLYDAPMLYKETRRGRPDPINAVNPCMTMLAGTQPDFLGSILPAEAWGMGFMSRMLMIYAGSATKPKLFGKARQKVDHSALIHDIKVISELHGEMEWTPEAEELMEDLHQSRIPPEPDHLKLKHYVTRRSLHVIKLSMISACSRSSALTVDVRDVRRAVEWLLEAEATMPEVFKDMSGKSDGQVIQDLHYYLWEISDGGTKKIHRARIDTFLMDRTPAYNVENIIRVCINAGIIITDPQGVDFRETSFFFPGARNKDKYE